MKLFLPFIVGTSIILAGLTPAFGFSLPKRGMTQSANRWPYTFGDRYTYDNAGSSWNYDSGYRDHHSKRQPKYWHSRFKYKVEGAMDENFQDLIEHLSEHNFHHISHSHNDPICK